MAPTTVQDIERWIGQLEGGRDGQPFDGPKFMRPFHFAIMACEVHRRGSPTVVVPAVLEGYAARMHLWQSIGLAAPREIKERNPGGRFHPLSPINSESSADEVASGVVDVFRKGGTGDKRTLDSVRITMSEIFGNAYFHSASAMPISGLACAQSWPAAQMAQVAVADIGIGVRESLGGNPQHIARLAAGNALELATELFVTGKPEGRHSGYGLAVARQLMEKHGGRFFLLSGDEAFCATESEAKAQKLQRTWQGTIVVLEWNTDRPFDIGAVYDSWPPLGNSDDYF